MAVSAETLQARVQCNDKLKILKAKTANQEHPVQQSYPFRHGEIKAFLDE